MQRLRERFAGDCNTACNNANLSDELKAICDAGSQQYCTTGNNIYTNDCKNYLTRVTGNTNAVRTNVVYANPIKFQTVNGVASSNLNTYYDNLLKSIVSSATSASEADVNAIVKIIKDNNPAYGTSATFNDLILGMRLRCANGASDSLCSETTAPKNWLVTELETIATNKVATLTTRNEMIAYVKSLVDDLPTFTNNKKIFTKFPLSHKSIIVKVVSLMSEADLNRDDNSFGRFRLLSTHARLEVDAFVMKLLVPGLILTAPYDMTAAQITSMYSNAITNIALFTGAPFRKYITKMNSAATETATTGTDPFLTAITSFDTTSINSCLINPFTANCKSFTGVLNTNDTQRMLDASVTYCSNAENVMKKDCVNHINANLTKYDANDVNTKMLTYCLSDLGKVDAQCKPFSSITGSAAWLNNSTKNTTNPTTGAITTECGKIGGLSKDTCQNVCNTYPDICVNDVKQKCAIGTNRYSTSKEFFEPNTERFLSDTELSDKFNGNFNIFILFILFVFFVALITTYRSTSHSVSKINTKIDFLMNSTFKTK